MRGKRLRLLWVAVPVVVVALVVIAAISIRRGVGPSPACRQASSGPVQEGTHPYRITSGGQERCYLLHVPPGLDTSQQVPPARNRGG
jgi:poly(3-hydroxybutyrate) depolymerase